MDLIKEIPDKIESTESITNTKKTDMEESAISIIREQKKELQKIENLIKENKELRNLLDAKYSAKELFVYSIVVSLALIFSLICWFSLDLKLIHPIISIPVLIGSLGFVGLAYWRMK